MSTVYYATEAERTVSRNYRDSRAAACRNISENEGSTAGRVSRKNAARARKKAIRRAFICSAAVFMVCMTVLFGSRCRTFADSQNENGLNKYYTSIEVKSGDTLWALADDYMIGSEMTKKEYVDQLIRINNLPASGEIRTGENIIVVYYSNEEL